MWQLPVWLGNHHADSMPIIAKHVDKVWVKSILCPLVYEAWPSAPNLRTYRSTICMSQLNQK